jgi:hypothetical protein
LEKITAFIGEFGLRWRVSGERIDTSPGFSFSEDGWGREDLRALDSEEGFVDHIRNMREEN